MTNGTTKRTEGKFEIEEGEEGFCWVKGPCKSCEVVVEGEWEEGEDLENDWFCTGCWPHEKDRRQQARIKELEAKLAAAVGGESQGEEKRTPEGEGVPVGEIFLSPTESFPTVLVATRPDSEGATSGVRESYIKISSLPFQMKDAIKVMVQIGQIK